MKIVCLGNVTAGCRLFDVNIGHVRGDAADFGVIDALAIGADLPACVHFDALTQRQLQVVAKCLVVVESDQLVAAGGFDVLIHLGDDREACHYEDVGAEVRDALRDVAIHAGNQRDDDD